MRNPVAAILFVAVLTASISQPAWSEEASKYAYVDVRKVMAESKIGKSSKAEYEKFVKQRNAELAKEKEQIEAMRTAYQKEQLLLTDAQKEKRQKDFQEKVAAFQKMGSEAENEVRKKEAQAYGSAMTQIREVIAQIAKEQNLNLVFEKHQQPVLFAKDGPDLTDIVIKRLDAKAGK